MIGLNVSVADRSRALIAHGSRFGHASATAQGWSIGRPTPDSKTDAIRGGRAHTEAINHEPAITHMQTGNQLHGRPCLGSWVSYGFGPLNKDLPAFVVLVKKPTNTEHVQAIGARLWSSGYLSGEHSG